MRKIKDIRFKHNTNKDKSILNTLKNCKDLEAGTQCVYVYSLVDQSINYPKKEGKIIYIGEASRNNEPTGKRFSGHISKSPNEGNNFTTNYTISSFYYLEHEIRLEIYVLDSSFNEQQRKEQEKRLYRLHVKEYGALPIGQGTTGENFTPNSLELLQYNQTENSIVIQNM